MTIISICFDLQQFRRALAEIPKDAFVTVVAVETFELNGREIKLEKVYVGNILKTKNRKTKLFLTTNPEKEFYFKNIKEIIYHDKTIR